MSSLSLLKKLGSESLVYGLSGMLTRFISVFLTPIYTGIFAPADYGTASLVLTLSALLSTLLILSLDNSMARWYYDNESEEDRDVTLNTFLWSCCGCAVILAVVVGVFRDQIAMMILGQPETAPLLPLMALNLPLSVFNVFTVSVLRMQRRPVATTVFTLVSSLFGIALNILFVILLRLGLPGIFYAQLGVSLLAVAWTIALFRDRISPGWFDWERWRKMFLFSMPLIPGTLAYWVLNLSSVYFIQMSNDANEVGLYQIAMNVASVMTLFSGAFQMAWGPFAYSIHKQAEAKRTYSQALLIFLSVTCLMSLGVMLFAPEVLIVLTHPNYYDAAFVVGLLAFNHVLIGASSIAGIGPGIAQNNKAYGTAMVVSALLLVVLNLLLVPRFGKEGAATSILLSQSIIPLAVFWHGQKLYPIPYKFGKAAAIAGVSLTVGAGVMMWLGQANLPLPSGIAVKLAIVLGYLAFLFIVLRGEINRNDLLAASATAA